MQTARQSHKPPNPKSSGRYKDKLTQEVTQRASCHHKLFQNQESWLIQMKTLKLNTIHPGYSDDYAYTH
jgi:hypothetical protein